MKRVNFGTYLDNANIVINLVFIYIYRLICEFQINLCMNRICSR